MKLRNKKTGEIIAFGDVSIGTTANNGGHHPLRNYSSIVDLNAEWEDYEEPKTFWHILSNGGIIEKEATTDELRQEFITDAKQIGNYFGTREEAEKAVEKFKAVKRLKDKGFKLKGWYMPKNTLNIEIDGGFPKDVSLCDVMDDLDIVFGGER